MSGHLFHVLRREWRDRTFEFWYNGSATISIYVLEQVGPVRERIELDVRSTDEAPVDLADGLTWLHEVAEDWLKEHGALGME